MASASKASRAPGVQHEPQAQPAAAALQRGQELGPRLAAFGGLVRDGIALVAAPADQLARQQARIGLQRDARGARHPLRRVQARQRGAGGQQPRHAGMQHQRDRRIDPFHRGAGAGRAIGLPVRELPAAGAGGTESREGAPDLVAPEAGVVRDQRLPGQRPAELRHQLARQSEREDRRHPPRPGPCAASAPSHRARRRIRSRPAPHGRRAPRRARPRSACAESARSRNRSPAAAAKLRTAAAPAGRDFSGARRWRRWPSIPRAAPARPCPTPHRGRARAAPST